MRSDFSAATSAFHLARVLLVAVAGGLLPPGNAVRAADAALSDSRAPAGGPAMAGRDTHITFTRDIAPIVFKRCAPCHRPGMVAPFSLLRYTDVRKHARDIAKVTEDRYMPPWLPEPGYGDFANNRRLTTNEVDSIRRWVEQGAIEGDPAALPPAPKWTEGWQLGPPDLVVQMPAPYTLGPDGKDLYRNFVIPVPLRESRFVRAFEFHPGAPCVHHARLKLDPTPQSRRLDELDPEVGFGGMNVPARFPPGHLLTWQPGKVPSRESEDLPWLLEKGSDLVLQLHLRRTGKPETLRCTVGFYFTDQRPTVTPFLIGLIAQLIDIPAGAPDYTVQRRFTLPAAVDVLAVLPHAHYLGKRIHAFATLPDGATRELLLITNWDFNWQDEYRYRQPVPLPAGTTLTMQWSYDNSEANVQNPNHPPRRVTYGPQSSDEMGEVWFQVLPRDPADLGVLEREYRRMSLEETAAYYENVLRQNPANAAAHFELGKALGPLGREAEAFSQFQRAVELAPRSAEPHYYLGLIYLDQQTVAAAVAEFETALRLEPGYYRAYNGLGLAAMMEADWVQAENFYRSALRANPDDPAARRGLARARQARQETQKK